MSESRMTGAPAESILERLMELSSMPFCFLRRVWKTNFTWKMWNKWYKIQTFTTQSGTRWRSKKFSNYLKYCHKKKLTLLAYLMLRPILRKRVFHHDHERVKWWIQRSLNAGNATRQRSWGAIHKRVCGSWWWDMHPSAIRPGNILKRPGWT